MVADRVDERSRRADEGGRRPTRQRMIDSAVALLRQRSSAGVTVDAVLTHSGAPRGSVYHHFPGGRDQIVREAVHSAGQFVAQMIDSASDSVAVITGFERFWERVLNDTGFLAGCPVVALTVDAGGASGAEAELVRGTFMLWRERLCSVFAADAIPSDRAQRLSGLVLAAAEGAIVLSRAQRSYEPLHEVCGELRDLVDLARHEHRDVRPEPEATA